MQSANQSNSKQHHAATLSVGSSSGNSHEHCRRGKQTVEAEEHPTGATALLILELLTLWCTTPDCKPPMAMADMTAAIAKPLLAQGIPTNQTPKFLNTRKRDRGERARERCVIYPLSAIRFLATHLIYLPGLHFLPTCLRQYLSDELETLFPPRVILAALFTRGMAKKYLLRSTWRSVMFL